MIVRDVGLILIAVTLLLSVDDVYNMINPPPQQCWVTLENEQGVEYQKFVDCSSVEQDNLI